MNDEIHADIKELKADMKELVRQGIIHNELLRTHEARSLELKKGQDLLEARLAPVERQSNIVALILKGLGAISVGAAIQGVIRHFL